MYYLPRSEVKTDGDVESLLNTSVLREMCVLLDELTGVPTMGQLQAEQIYDRMDLIKA